MIRNIYEIEALILTDVENGQVVLLLLYDKEDASTVKVNVVKQLVRDMGFDI